MRDLHLVPDAIRECMVAKRLELKHAELFVRQPMAGDPVTVKNARVRREAGKDRRGGAVFSPVKNVGQRRPVRFVSQVRLAWFSAGHDDAIKPAVQEILDAEIEVAQMLLSCIAPRKIGQRVKLQGNRGIAGSSIEEFEELHFGVFQRGVRHVVDQRDSNGRHFPGVCGWGVRTIFPRQQIWNAPAVNYDRHFLSPKLIRTRFSLELVCRLVQRLRQVSKDVVNMFDAHAQTNHFWRHARFQLFFRS